MKNLILTALLLAGISAHGAVSQWVAYNDHYRGPNTGPNVSEWTLFTTVAGAPVGGPPGNHGFLTNVVTGSAVPVTFTVTNVSATAVSVGVNAGGPAEGTPAGLAFSNYVDFATGVTTNVIQLAGASRVAHIFRNCDPTRRYSWRGTAVRANNYTDRWTLVEIDAAASTPAHAATPVTLRTYVGSPGTELEFAL